MHGELAALLEGFFKKRLISQRRVSPHTIASYRDTFRLLLSFAQQRLKLAPSKMGLTDLNAPFLTDFLESLERARSNKARTRNLRLTAIRSFLRFAALEAPEHSGLSNEPWRYRTSVVPVRWSTSSREPKSRLCSMR